MKFNTLRAIAHNIADSLGSGIGLLIGVYQTDIFGEAKHSPEQRITVNFLSGKATNGVVSSSLAGAIERYQSALSELCTRHGTSPAAFSTLLASYSSDRFSRRIVVTVEDHYGHTSVDEYVGTPARRVKVLDALGRIRRR